MFDFHTAIRHDVVSGIFRHCNRRLISDAELRPDDWFVRTFEGCPNDFRQLIARPKHTDNVDCVIDLREAIVGLVPENAVCERVDRNDIVALCPQVLWNVVGGLSRCRRTANDGYSLERESTAASSWSLVSGIHTVLSGWP